MISEYQTTKDYCGTQRPPSDGNANFEISIDIPLVHRPDFVALRQQRSLWGLERKRDGTKHKNAYLMPHINLEDLGKSKNLLLFIESRTRNDPEAFAWSDSQQIRMAASADAVKIMTCTGYTMMVRTPGAQSLLFLLSTPTDESRDMCCQSVLCRHISRLKSILE